MTYNEQYEAVQPPEIREAEEKYSVVEFYVDLGVARPDIRLMEIVTDYLKQNAPKPVAFITFAYHRETDDEPNLLQANLYLGEPIDIG